MNTFAESPLLFFMDNMPPILPVNATKDARKIVELADTGCDARLTMQPAKDFRHSPKLHKMKSSGWNLHTEDDKYDKCYDERFRMKNKRNTVDVEDYHFNKKNDSTNQRRRQRCPQQDETTEDKHKPVGRRSPTREFRTKLKMTSQEAHRWKDDKRICEVVVPNPVCPGYNVNSQNFPKSVNALTIDRQFEAQPKRSKIGGANLKFVCADHPEMCLDARKRDAGLHRENEIHMVLDYPENFETAGYPTSNASKTCKSHNRRWNGSPGNDVKNPLGQPSQRNNRFPRHSPRNARTVVSPKSDEPTKDWRGTTDGKARSRTRSPPIDRRKSTRPFQKSCCENTEQCRSRYDSESVEPFGRTPDDVEHGQPRKTNSDGSMKMFVDRAVDKDSLSNLFNVATSVDRLTDTTDSKALDSFEESRDRQRNTRTTYWDFIPLNDENYVEYKRNATGKRNQSLSGYNSRTTPTESLSRESARDSRTNGIADGGLRDSLNSCLYDDPSAASETAVETTHGTSCPNSPKAAEVSKNYDEQQRGESRVGGKLLFGYHRRPIGQAKSESNGTRENSLANILDRKGVKANFADWTAACLKRKIGKSRANGVSTISNQSTTTMDAKFRSVLPIRIGNRRRSKNPSAAKFRFNAQPRVADVEETTEESRELPEDSIDQPKSVRSRTKPKLRPSVPHNRIIVDSVEASEGFQRIGNAQSEAEVKSFLEDELAARSVPLGKKNLTDYDTRDASMSGSVDAELFDGDADDKSQNNVERKECDDFNAFYTEDDERLMTKLTNGAAGRKVVQKKGFKEPSRPTGFPCNGFKEICCFHLNDAQNIVCNSYYDKDNQKHDTLRSRKPTVARSRF